MIKKKFDSVFSTDELILPSHLSGLVEEGVLVSSRGGGELFMRQQNSSKKIGQIERISGSFSGEKFTVRSRWEGDDRAIRLVATSTQSDFKVNIRVFYSGWKSIFGCNELWVAEVKGQCIAYIRRKSKGKIICWPDSKVAHTYMFCQHKAKITNVDQKYMLFFWGLMQFVIWDKL